MDTRELGVDGENFERAEVEETQVVEETQIPSHSQKKRPRLKKSTGVSQRKAKSGVAGKVEALQLELQRHVLVPSTSLRRQNPNQPLKTKPDSLNGTACAGWAYVICFLQHKV
jgi:hypothetical protein